MARSRRAMTIGKNGSIHSLFEAPRAVFRHDPIEPLVVLVMRHSFELLGCESKADGEHIARRTKPGQRAVIESGAITDAIAAPIERQKRHHKDIALHQRPSAR